MFKLTRPLGDSTCAPAKPLGDVLAPVRSTAVALGRSRAGVGDHRVLRLSPHTSRRASHGCVPTRRRYVCGRLRKGYRVVRDTAETPSESPGFCMPHARKRLKRPENACTLNSLNSDLVERLDKVVRLTCQRALHRERLLALKSSTPRTCTRTEVKGLVRNDINSNARRWQ